MHWGSSRRSNLYASFLTCSDPKGVAEYGTVIRISKVSPDKRRQEKDEDQKKHKNLHALWAEERDQEKEASIAMMGGRQQLLCPSSLQPMQVHKRPRDLTLVLNPWPNLGLEELDGKGEMYVMIQDGDDKNREELERSYHFGKRSSSSSIMELKKEIKERLARQSTVAPNVGAKESYHHRNRPDSSSTSDLPSTSSSQSTSVNSSSLTSSSSSMSSTASQKRTLKSNLVGQLTGLESLPNTTPRRQRGSGKLPYPRRPTFDINFPIGKEPQCLPQGSDTRDSTTNEVVETMRLKGLLKRTAVLDQVSMICCHQPEARRMDDRPPIVIIDPLRFSRSDLEGLVSVSNPPEDGSCADKTYMKSRSGRELAWEQIQEVKTNSNSSTSLNLQNGVRCKEVQRELLEEIAPVEKEEKNSNKEKAEQPKKRKTPKRDSVAEKTAADTGKALEKKTIKPHDEMKSQDSTKLRASKLRNPGNGVQTVKKRASTHQSAKARPISKYKAGSTPCGSVDLKTIYQSSEQTIINRPLRLAAVAQGSKGPKLDIQCTCEDKFASEVAGTSLAELFPEDGIRESQTRVTDYKGDNPSSPGEIMSVTTHEELDDKIMSMTTHEELDDKIMSMTTHEELDDKIMSMTTHQELEDKIMAMTSHEEVADNQGNNHSSFYEIILPNHEDSHSINGHIAPGENITQDFHEHDIQGQHKFDEISISEIPSEDGHNSLSRSTTLSAKDADVGDITAEHFIGREACHAKEKLKVFLLSSPSFITHAEELFALEVNPSVKLSITTDGDSDTSSSRVLLDYAGELLELKHHRYAQSHPLLPRSLEVMNLKNCTCFDQILEETCEAIETLRSCFKPSQQNVSMDALYRLVDRDIKQAGTADRMWDVGWKNMFSADDVERILCELDRLVFASLIEDALEDLAF